MKVKDNIEDIDFRVNSAQLQFLMLEAKDYYLIWSRGTGKSFVVGAQVDKLIRKCPRSVVTLSQCTYGQALTKTLPSTFHALSLMGYRKYDPKTQTGDYVVCRTPPSGWRQPYEHILSYEHCITFSNGTTLQILSQDGNSRGVNSDYNICDEALTLDKDQFDKETAPTNRGHEQIWGKQSKHPLSFHHGNLFVTSAPYTAKQRWLLDPARYYEEERGINIIDRWNSMVKMQLQLVEAKLKDDTVLFREIWNECVRIRRTIHPFVSQNGTLFHLASIFDNLQNVGLSYIMNEYALMDRMTFLIEILNFIPDKIDNCYYHFGEQSKYYAVHNNTFLHEFAEETNYDFDALSDIDSRYDGDCNPNQPLEICFDWGTSASFMEVAQCGNYDYSTQTALIGRIVDCTINEFFVKRDEEDDVEINVLCDRFSHYYRYHANKVVHMYRDRYGDVRHPTNKRTYNEMAISRLEKKGWKIIVKTHAGMEPPQHDKYLLWSAIAAEKEPKYPIKRFNASKCKHIILSMNNTRLKESMGKFSKDKSSERNNSIAPEDATHFGDVVDKRIWTKYGHLLKNNYLFVPNRI